MVHCDVTGPDDIAAVADRVRAVGRSRCLVHTAGVSREIADPRTVLDVDLLRQFCDSDQSRRVG